MRQQDWAVHRDEGVPILMVVARTLGIARKTVRAGLAPDGPSKFRRGGRSAGSSLGSVSNCTTSSSGRPGARPTRSSWPGACNARWPPREAHGGEGQMRVARFRVRRFLEDVAFGWPPPETRDHRPPWHTRLVTAEENVGLLGASGTGKTHLATGLSVLVSQAGHRVRSATASQRVDRLAGPTRRGNGLTSFAASPCTRCPSSTWSATPLRTWGRQPLFLQPVNQPEGRRLGAPNEGASPQVLPGGK